jgi:hypothetical protein
MFMAICTAKLADADHRVETEQLLYAAVIAIGDSSADPSTVNQH